ncbi:DUF1016 N-terminal domain-containing protein [Fibrobacter sp.]|uniref:DUF1016 N-terminal domain-containing protein n=1 Tax=Fibrobacter sp. TaxID=35828 RepID=UPI0025C454DE|nr:DUF1016 N-terminal domain-containing protein [Fibrobacter sp.]MBR3071340.1 hypothetical protein [Fibrobacter sp.]
MTKEVNEKALQSQFSTILNQIQRMRSLAVSEVNEKHLSSVWFVGQYVSQKIKCNEWGTKVVAELADYIHTQDPTLKGFSKRNIYNMVMFYDEYSSEGFLNFVAEKLNSEFVQTGPAQLETGTKKNGLSVIWRPKIVSIPYGYRL